MLDPVHGRSTAGAAGWGSRCSRSRCPRRCAATVGQASGSHGGQPGAKRHRRTLPACGRATSCCRSMATASAARTRSRTLLHIEQVGRQVEIRLLRDGMVETRHLSSHRSPSTEAAYAAAAKVASRTGMLRSPRLRPRRSAIASRCPRLTGGRQATPRHKDMRMSGSAKRSITVTLERIQQVEQPAAVRRHASDRRSPISASCTASSASSPTIPATAPPHPATARSPTSTAM